MLAIILVSYTMIVLDISIVITALPKIHHDLGFSATALSWVQNAYLLAFGGLLLLGARAGDLLGRRRMFRAVHDCLGRRRHGAVRGRVAVENHVVWGARRTVRAEYKHIKVGHGHRSR